MMTKEQVKTKREAVMARLGFKSLQEMKQNLSFKAFFLCSDAVQLELNVQIISDLVASRDGRLNGGNYSDDYLRRSIDDPQHVDIYFSNPDLIYADKFEWPRHGQGIILSTLFSIFSRNHPNLYPFKFTQYGKPEALTFDFAKDRLRKKAEKQGVEISNFYMIGDNPAADIRGGNRNGCQSILVKTGVWNPIDEETGLPLDNDS